MSRLVHSKRQPSSAAAFDRQRRAKTGPRVEQVPHREDAERSRIKIGGVLDFNNRARSNFWVADHNNLSSGVGAIGALRKSRRKVVGGVASLKTADHLRGLVRTARRIVEYPVPLRFALFARRAVWRNSRRLEAGNRPDAPMQDVVFVAIGLRGR